MLTFDRERYGEAPTSAYLAHAYDAATMLFRAINEVAVGDGDTLYIGRAKLRDALAGSCRFQVYHRGHLLRRVRRLRRHRPRTNNAPTPIPASPTLRGYPLSTATRPDLPTCVVAGLLRGGVPYRPHVAYDELGGRGPT